MEPASITIFGVEANPSTYALGRERFTIGYRTTGFDVNIQPDALSDACCPDDFRIDIVQLACCGHGHQLVWQYELGDGDVPHSISPPIFINGYRQEVGPGGMEAVLQDGDLVVCGCQTTPYPLSELFQEKIGAGPCIFQYQAARTPNRWMNGLSQLETLPLRLQQEIFSYLDPTLVAVSVAATSSTLCRAVNGGKVPFKELPVSGEISPCTLRLWKPVTRGGFATFLKLALDFKRVLKNQVQAILYLDTVLDILGESKLRSIALQLHSMERTSPDVEIKIIQIIQDQRETLKGLWIHGDCSTRSMWQRLPRLTRVTRLHFHPVASSVDTVDQENEGLAETEVLAMLLEKLSDSLTTLSVYGGVLRGDLIRKEHLANLVHVRYGVSGQGGTSGLPSWKDGQYFSSLFWPLPQFLETLTVFILTEEDFEYLGELLCSIRVRKLSLHIRAGWNNHRLSIYNWASILSSIPSPTLEVLSFYVDAEELLPSVLLHMADDRQNELPWPLRICSIHAKVDWDGRHTMPLAFLPLPFVASYPFLEMLSVDVDRHGSVSRNFIPERLRKTRRETNELLVEHFGRPFFL